MLITSVSLYQWTLKFCDSTYLWCNAINCRRPTHSFQQHWVTPKHYRFCKCPK